MPLPLEVTRSSSSYPPGIVQFFPLTRTHSCSKYIKLRASPCRKIRQLVAQKSHPVVGVLEVILLPDHFIMQSLQMQTVVSFSPYT